MTAKMDIGLKKAERTDIVEELKKVLADSFAIYLKTHGYHWNVRGPQFFSLHNMLEEQYREIWAALDEIAERMRALGELAPQGFAAFANHTGIKDGDAEKDAKAMIEELVGDHGTVIATLRAALEVADQAGDEATVDLLTQRLAAHEKTAWMLRASSQ